MTSRKTAADNEGWRKGQGAYSKEVKLNRTDPWRNPQVLSDGLSDGKGAYTDNRSVLTRKDAMTPENETNAKARDIYSDVCKNSLDDDAGGSRPGPIKYGVD